MNPKPPAPGASAPPPIRPALAWVGLAALFLSCIGAGWLFERIGAPLPWMIGPLLLTAAIFIGFDPPIVVPNRLRPFGQIVVATQVGLAFSPAAFGLIAELAPVLVGTALVTGACIFLVAVVSARLTGQSLAQAFLSAAPTSPVEAATMAMEAGFNPMPVIFSQTVRLSAVVLLLPAALYAIDGWPKTGRPPVTLEIGDPVSIVALAAVGIAFARLFRVLRVPNPNFLGPMSMAAALSASGFGLAPYPSVVMALAQVVLGAWLGSTFRREVMSSALRLSLASVATALLLLLLCSLSGVGIALLTGVDWRTLVLGAAPGGAVEMALTAKFLEQNVVLITTFHLIRIFIFMPNIPWIVRLIVRRERRNKKGASAS
ncbi:AbrB family transcriptional regulator [Notoacmeibacter sp. MSK16QG-6]|uniref:AbrB family transcriptional regulator n=1 Tax=Notoacmeibacter sp. MSK16QG-6 TaxID=2957982 RepID=UPI00209F8B83|nr:AbrB family transcriptional regulator [Notoacmeibacter sp. MSK16QG-6]